MGLFVDVHSHVVPCLDDGARTLADGIALIDDAAAHGTRVLVATPHVHAPWDSYPWSDERAACFADAFPQLQAHAARVGLRLEAGAELFPGAGAGDLHRYRLGPAAAVLVEFPGDWVGERAGLEDVWEQAEALEAAALLPVLAHPERNDELQERPERAREFADRGWVLCPNAPSLAGRHGAAAERTAWRLLELGVVGMVASDAHRVAAGRGPARPARLDEAYRLLAARYGDRRALALCDGSALRDVWPGLLDEAA